MRILVVEDERDLANALARGLRRKGYVVDIAATGEQGWELGEVNEYDLVVLDLNLPEMDGLECATDYQTLLVEYYGPAACSSTTSYGVPVLPDNLDNRFASGKAYSNCDYIYVYDFNNYSGPSYSCGANCSRFYALNDEVSSWKTTD